VGDAPVRVLILIVFQVSLRQRGHLVSNPLFSFLIFFTHPVLKRKTGNW